MTSGAVTAAAWARWIWWIAVGAAGCNSGTKPTTAEGTAIMTQPKDAGTTGLAVREGDRIVPAPAADEAVARGYPQWADKGAVHDGARLTVMTGRLATTVGEPVRIIHVAEVTTPGRSVYVMGPKPILGEHVDGTLVTPSAPATGDPLAPTGVYDGRVQPSPAVDHNYEITTYTFDTPGAHTVYWQMGPLRSNTLTFDVAPRT